MKKRRRTKKVIITICAIFAAVVLVLPAVISLFVYQAVFGGRFETAPWMMRSADEFDGLQRERYTFASNSGQELTGYRYFRENTADAKGVVVLAHGFGTGGHIAYIDIVNCLASNGYSVFAYDVTGNDESEGKAVNGLPQGLIDLDYALRFVKSSAVFEGLPIMLFGHSWGAYSAGSVLNLHPDVKAVVMGAGFDKPADMIDAVGGRMIGAGVKLILPHFSLMEKIKFGKYASYSCIGGFEASDAGVMVIHSVDDALVPFDRQFAVFEGKYGDDPRFIFVRFEDKGHSGLFGSEDTKKYWAEFNAGLEAYAKSKGVNVTSGLRDEYMREHGDKSKLYELDAELMGRILAFYDSYVE